MKVLNNTKVLPSQMNPRMLNLAKPSKLKQRKEWLCQRSCIRTVERENTVLLVPLLRAVFFMVSELKGGEMCFSFSWICSHLLLSSGSQPGPLLRFPRAAEKGPADVTKECEEQTLAVGLSPLQAELASYKEVAQA